MLVLSLTGCAKLRPDANAFLTRSEQALAISVDTLDAFFIIEKANRLELEKLVPGCHATAEALRLKAPAAIDAVVATLDAYRQAKGEGDVKMNVTIALATLQAMVAQVRPILEAWGSKKVPAEGGAK